MRNLGDPYLRRDTFQESLWLRLHDLEQPTTGKKSQYIDRRYFIQHWCALLLEIQGARKILLPQQLKMPVGPRVGYATTNLCPNDWSRNLVNISVCW